MENLGSLDEYDGHDQQFQYKVYTEDVRELTDNGNHLTCDLDHETNGSLKSSSSPSSKSSSRRHAKFVAITEIVWPDPNIFSQRSLVFFTLQNPLRRVVIAAVERPIWDRAVLFVISFNACVLLSHDPYDVPELLPVSPKRDILHTLSQVYTMSLYIPATNYNICMVADFQWILFD